MAPNDLARRELLWTARRGDSISRQLLRTLFGRFPTGPSFVLPGRLLVDASATAIHGQGGRKRRAIGGRVNLRCRRASSSYLLVLCRIEFHIKMRLLRLTSRAESENEGLCNFAGVGHLASYSAKGPSGHRARTSFLGFSGSIGSEQPK